MEDDSDKRHHMVARLRQSGWDNTPAGLADEIRGFLKSMKDEGTSIDSGSGNGYADLWIKVNGVEYRVSVEKSSQHKNTALK